MGGDVSGSKDQKAEPNVVPLCDILLVLLIIFMVVTPMLKKGVNVVLPEAANTHEQPEPGKMTTVHIKRDGSVYLDDKQVESLSKLTAMIEVQMEDKKQAEKSKILLKADAEIAYGKVTQVMDEIRRAQIEIVGLVTDKLTSD